MSGDSEFVSQSIEDLLVSLAEGVREAQEALDSAPATDAFGRKQQTYHLPYVDFTFEVGVQRSKTVNNGRTVMKMKARKASGEPSSEINSVIAGRLVSIPPGEGVPVPVLQLESEGTTLKKTTVTILASNSAGEILAGHQIELNLNLAATQNLSMAQGVEVKEMGRGTRLKDAVLVSDENGYAETTLQFDPGLDPKATVVLSAELGGERSNLTIVRA